MGMGSDEWNKGYFSAGPQGSQDARDGQAARLRDEAAREARQRAAADDAAWRPGPAHLPSWQPDLGAAYSVAGSPAGPATLPDTVKGCATAGAAFALAYAFIGLNLSVSFALLMWAVGGVVAGALAGVALYAAIVVLRFAFAVLALALKAAVWAGLALGVLYLLAQVA